MDSETNAQQKTFLKPALTQYFMASYPPWANYGLTSNPLIVKAIETKSAFPTAGTFQIQMKTKVFSSLFGHQNSWTRQNDMG